MEAAFLLTRPLSLYSFVLTGSNLVFASLDEKDYECNIRVLNYVTTPRKYSLFITLFIDNNQVLS